MIVIKYVYYSFYRRFTALVVQDGNLDIWFEIVYEFEALIYIQYLVHSLRSLFYVCQPLYLNLMCLKDVDQK